MSLVNIGVRKIGPGLKSFVKFKIFSSPNVRFKFNPTRIIETHLVKQPFDPELYQLLYTNYGGRWRARQLLESRWLGPNIPKLNLIDQMRILTCNQNLVLSFLQEKKILQLINSTIIDPTITDEIKSSFISILSGNNYWQTYYPYIDGIEFALRNIVDIKLRSNTVAHLFSCLRFSQRYVPDEEVKGKTPIARLITKAYNNGLLTEDVMDRLIHGETGLWSYRVVGDQVIMELKPV